MVELHESAKATFSKYPENTFISSKSLLASFHALEIFLSLIPILFNFILILSNR